MNTTLTFIGEITTPYQAIDDCPCNIQADGPLCELHIHEEYQPALLGLKAGQKILILYWLDQTDRTKLIQPVGEQRIKKGTFSLRSPHRPNPIGASELIIEEIGSGVVTVRGLDCLDKTKLLDIKPAIHR